MSNYKAGYNLENTARKLLTDANWVVVRAAGSKGAADLVALWPVAVFPVVPGLGQRVLFVQCKTDGYVPPTELRAFYTLACSVGAVPLVASWHKEGRAARTVRFREVFLGLDAKIRAEVEWKVGNDGAVVAG